MTPQTKVLLIGVASAAIAKFWFHKGTMEAVTFGLAGISVYSILTAHTDEKKTA